MEEKNKFDINLYHLWLTLQDLERYKFPKIIEKQLKEFLLKTEELLFPPILSDNDIVSQEFYYITKYK